MNTLIVEDSTRPEGSNCYARLAEADAWLMPRGLWPATPVAVDAETLDADMVAAKTAALLRGADWLNVLPGGRWKNEPVDEGRVMAFPRRNAPGRVPAYPAVAGLLAPYVDVAPGKAAGGVCRTIERA